MFKRSMQLLLIGSLGTAAVWGADDPFVGEWKLNPARSKLTDTMKVESVGANKYAFDFGAGRETILVDGTDQPGVFGTTLAVSVEGPDSWKVIRKKDGRMLVKAAWTLSKDGSTLTDNFTGIEPSGSTYNLNYVYQRTAPGSGFAGTWVSTSETVNSVFVLQIQPYDGDGLAFVVPSRKETKKVKFDGQDYTNQGPNVPQGSVSSLRRVNERTLEMTDKINGKLLDTRQIELSSDLKTLTMTVHIEGRAEPNILAFDRQ